MPHREIYQAIAEQLHAGKPVVQATVVHTRGSTPRKEGSTMLVRQDGSLVGTIGGGCGEAGVIQKARLSLLDGQFREEVADLTDDIAMDSEAVCGGTLRVFIEPWQPDPEHEQLALRLAELAGGNREVVLHQVIDAPPETGLLGRRVLLDQHGQSLYSQLPADTLLPPAPERKPYQLKSLEGYQVYSERWDPVPSLVIIGAGHIAEPLEHLGRMAGYRTVVVDDRRLFANRGRFPDADQVVCGPILEVSRQIELSRHHYVVLVTRGHTLDMDALKVFVERGEPLAYLGMIGSKRRISAVFQLLEEQGYSREALGDVHAPIGLNIGAETPAEIAVSVLAEMIAVRHHAGQDTRPLTLLSGKHPSLRRAAVGG